MLLARKMYEKSIKSLYEKHSNKTFIIKLSGNTKRSILFRINVQLRQITELHLQCYFKSLVGLRLLLVVYLMH